MGSGTTWIPDAVSLPARHRMIGSWLVMLHGFGFVQYDKQGGPRGDEQFGSLLLWGANRHSGRTSHSALAESEAVLDRRNTVFGRVELVQKTAEELVLPTEPGGFAPDSTFNVAAFSVGYIREVGRTSMATVGLGFQGSLNVVPTSLDPIYGSRTPVGGMLFLRIRPIHAPHDMATPMPPMGH